MTTAKHFKVISWNTGQRFRTFGECPEPTADASLGDVASRILRWSPDVVCLQEIRSAGQLTVLLDRLGPDWHGELTDMPKSDRQVAVITPLDADRTTFEEIQTTVGRCALRLTIAGPTDRTVHVVAAHANAYDREARLLYLTELLTVIEAIPGGEPVLLIGDLNIDPWFGRLFVHDRASLARLHLGWRSLFQRRRHTFMRLLQLDHALLRDAGAVPAVAGVIAGTRGFRRDHAPVFATLTLGATKGPDHARR